MALDRSTFLASRRPVPKPIEVPGLGTVYVRGMNGSERDRFEELHGTAGRRGLRARIVAFHACDEAGELLFGESDVPELGQLAPETLDPIVAAGLAASGLSSEAVEDVAKN